MCVMMFCPQFFQKRGVSEAMSVYDLFNAVTGLDIPVGAEDEAKFMAEVGNTRLSFSVECGACLCRGDNDKC